MNRFPYRQLGLSAAVLAMATALIGCDIFETRVAGGGSEAGNAIVAGRVMDAAGNPLEGVTVRAFREDADPVRDSASAPCEPFQSDAAGRYRLRCGEGTIIHLTGTHPERRISFLLNGIRPIAKREIQAPDGVLRVPGRLLVPLPDSGAVIGGYVYLPGTSVYKHVDSLDLAAGHLILDPVPAGIVASVLLAHPETSLPQSRQTLAANVTVASAQETTVSLFGNWAYSLRLKLDLVSAGKLEADLPGFPLLVRLSDADLDFTQAGAHGEDLRFAKADGAPLPFAIESWDAAASRAAIWVRMDTVYADNRGQTLTLYWGNKQAQAAPASRPVFDTASGFADVWHLSETRDSTHTPGVYRDAVPAGRDGDDYISSDGIAGAIGGGLDIVGRMWVEMRYATPRMQPAQAMTLSAWVRPDSLGDSISILAQLENGYSLELMPDSTARFEFRNGRETVTVESGPLPIRDGKWHQVAAVFDGATAGIWVDGGLASRLPAVGPVQYSGSPDRRFFMGNYSQDVPGFDNYRGALDEIELSRVARGSGWLALAYANQKPGSTVWLRLPGPSP